MLCVWPPTRSSSIRESPSSWVMRSMRAPLAGGPDSAGTTAAASAAGAGAWASAGRARVRARAGTDRRDRKVVVWRMPHCRQSGGAARRPGLWRFPHNRPMSDEKTPTPTLLLVDGSSYLYRAFFAGGDAMSTTLPDGTVQKTGAIRILINMMQKLLKDHPAAYGACVFDAKGPTFRDAIYPEYKAQRSPMPDDLRSQIAPINEVVRLMGWPVLDVPGVEADDVIGTLAVTAAQQGMNVIISSGDKDLAQLVNERITIIDTMSGKVRDLAGVEAEFGVPARLMLDYQMLVGDQVDNVPGVQGVGPKTAVKLLQEYGSVDALVAQADQIKGAVGEKLRKALDWLPTGRQLLTIKTDCDLNGWVPDMPALDAIRIGQPQTEPLKTFYETYGFKGLAKALGGDERPSSTPRPSGERAGVRGAPTNDLFSEAGPVEASETSATPSSGSLAYDTILTWDLFNTWLAKVEAADLVAVDTETTSLDEMVAQIVGISFSVTP